MSKVLIRLCFWKIEYFEFIKGSHNTIGTLDTIHFDFWGSARVLYKGDAYYKYILFIDNN